ncbi:MAG: Gfo/Idh/MocA family oxidoreductase [Armatimonadetes bacterium]|nr:Gfo/Idh/MocA family oxidoreductase [Armatimonadota bacterium]
MQRVKLGIIGCGVIGRVHAEAAAACPLVELTAVADLREEMAAQVAEAFSVKSVYRDGLDLIAEAEVDAVVLALPTAGRFALAMSAFEHGKHVLTEKPVAMNTQQLLEMIEAQGELVAACCSSRFRFTASAAAAEEFLATGALGRLRLVRCRFIGPAEQPPSQPPPPWRLSRQLNGGGILVNWGCYDLDYLLGLLRWQLVPRLVLAQCWPVPEAFSSWVAPGSDAETHFVAHVLCDGGTVISLERAEYAAARPDAAWEIIGDRGSLSLNMLPSKDKRLVFYEASSTRGVVEHVIWQGDDDWAATRLGPLEDFALAILNGTPPKTRLSDALLLQRVSDAIYSSAETGAAVEL